MLTTITLFFWASALQEATENPSWTMAIVEDNFVLACPEGEGPTLWEFTLFVQKNTEQRFTFGSEFGSPLLMESFQSAQLIRLGTAKVPMDDLVQYHAEQLSVLGYFSFQNRQSGDRDIYSKRTIGAMNLDEYMVQVEVDSLDPYRNITSALITCDIEFPDSVSILEALTSVRSALPRSDINKLYQNGTFIVLEGQASFVCKFADKIGKVAEKARKRTSSNLSTEYVDADDLVDWSGPPESSVSTTFRLEKADADQVAGIISSVLTERVTTTGLSRRSVMREFENPGQIQGSDDLLLIQGPVTYVQQALVMAKKLDVPSRDTSARQERHSLSGNRELSTSGEKDADESNWRLPPTKEGFFSSLRLQFTDILLVLLGLAFWTRSRKPA